MCICRIVALSHRQCIVRTLLPRTVDIFKQFDSTNSFPTSSRMGHFFDRREIDDIRFFFRCCCACDASHFAEFVLHLYCRLPVRCYTRTINPKSREEVEEERKKLHASNICQQFFNLSIRLDGLRLPIYIFLWPEAHRPLRFVSS